jgi:hypothetical protein
MLLNKIKKTKNRFRAYPTRQAIQTSGSTARDHPDFGHTQLIPERWHVAPPGFDLPGYIPRRVCV